MNYPTKLTIEHHPGEQFPWSIRFLHTEPGQEGYGRHEQKTSPRACLVRVTELVREGCVIANRDVYLELVRADYAAIPESERIETYLNRDLFDRVRF